MLGAIRSLPRGLTADSLASIFLLKVHLDPSYRLLAAIFGMKKSPIDVWINAIRDFVFLNDPMLIRNRSLTIGQNLRDLLEEGHQVRVNYNIS